MFNVLSVDCYAVPHTEKEEEQYVAINKDYHKSMLAAKRHTNRKEVIVGWYTTTTYEGSVLIDNSSLIHDFYCNECENPVHLVIDTTLSGDSVASRAFVNAPMTVGPHTFGNMFQELKVDMAIAPYEAICLREMVKGQQHYLNGERVWKESTILAALPPASKAIADSSAKLLAIIDEVLAYVNAVVEGSRPGLPEIGMALADALGASQSVSLSDFQTVFQTKSQDSLMISYLTSLLQNQLAIAEKLNEII